MALCINGWPVEQCIERFEALATIAFQPRPSSRLPLFSWMIDFFADGRYAAHNLESALKEAFGKHRSILECSRATASGTRVGLPVTTIRGTSTCIFTNYNGVGTRSPGCGLNGSKIS